MTDTIPAELAERRVIATALKTLRTRRSLSQADVAHNLGLSTQAYQKYEGAERRFSPDRLQEILTAIGVSQDDLEIERARILGREPKPTERGSTPQAAGLASIPVWGAARAGTEGIEVYDVGEPVRTFDLANHIGRSPDMFEIVGESLLPWGNSGDIVAVDRNRWPAAGKACVIELQSGQILIKFYVRTTAGQLFVSELQPEERIFPIALERVKGVYAVTVKVE
jgi:transcriptional regulator with XRE-family HTH domain